jgi:predicted transposase/invertase (TIGR01784 family)
MIAKLKSLAEEVGNPHDAFFKSLLGRRAMIVEFLRNYLPKEVTADFDLRTLEVVKDSFISEELRRYFSDLIFRVKLKSGEDVYVYILLEHKSAPEKWVALQLLGYKVKLWEQAKEAGAAVLPLVIPVVVYHGRQRWNVGRNFQSLVAGSQREEWRRYVPDFEYYLVDLSLYSDDEIKGSVGLRVGLMLMKYIFRVELGDRLEEIISPLKELPENRWFENFAPVVKYLSSVSAGLTPEEIRKKLEVAIPKNRGGIMQTLAEVWKQEGLQQGLQQGQKTAAEIVLSQLKWRFGQISARSEKQIFRLPLSTLKELGEALPGFAKPSDLTAWLREHAAKRTA